jgi:hypothetical protein
MRLLINLIGTHIKHTLQVLWTEIMKASTHVCKSTATAKQTTLKQHFCTHGISHSGQWLYRLLQGC